MCEQWFKRRPAAEPQVHPLNAMIALKGRQELIAPDGGVRRLGPRLMLSCHTRLRDEHYLISPAMLIPAAVATACC